MSINGTLYHIINSNNNKLLDELYDKIISVLFASSNELFAILVEDNADKGYSIIIK